MFFWGGTYSWLCAQKSHMGRRSSNPGPSWVAVSKANALLLLYRSGPIIVPFLVCFGRHTQRCSGGTPAYVLRNQAWQGQEIIFDVPDKIRFSLTLGRSSPDLLYYCSEFVFKLTWGPDSVLKFYKNLVQKKFILGAIPAYARSLHLILHSGSLLIDWVSICGVGYQSLVSCLQCKYTTSYTIYVAFFYRNWDHD